MVVERQDLVDAKSDRRYWSSSFRLSKVRAWWPGVSWIAVDVFGSRSSSTLTASTIVSQLILGCAIIYVLSVTMKVCRGMVWMVLLGANLLHGPPGYVLATPTTSSSKQVHCGAGRTTENHKVSSSSCTSDIHSLTLSIVLQILRHPR